MVAKAYIDRTDTLEAVERYGALTRLVRRVRVVGLTNTDYGALWTALATAGVPLAGTQLSGVPNLVLVERTPRLANDDKGTCDVDLVYEQGSKEGQSIDTPPYGVLVGETQSSLNQVSSNADGNGNQIVLAHTYPDDDQDYPGETKLQGGQIQFFQPQTTLRYKGIKTTRYPWLISRYIIGAVNNAWWSGCGPLEWLCTASNWTLHDAASPNRYVFDFEFQHNPDTWNPTCVFIDDRTGKPPPGLVLGVGIQYIRKQREVNFEALIGTRVQGG